jgi:hypothetical protein
MQNGFLHLCVLQHKTDADDFNASTEYATHSDCAMTTVGNQAAGHVFAQNLQDICKGEAVPPNGVAVMRSTDGRNGSSKKLPYLAFLVPERGRYLWMRSWEAWGLRKCSLCGVHFIL